jgi:hypothetical protein
MRGAVNEVDRLLGIEPGIADGVVAVLEVGVGDHARAAGAFGDVLAGHLDVDAASVRALGAVHVEERLDLLEDALEAYVSAWIHRFGFRVSESWGRW